MTKEECIKRRNEFKTIEYNGFKVSVFPTGKIYDKSIEGKILFRKWRYNKDGYIVVSLGNKEKWRTVGVHILVAKAWVPNLENKNEVNHLDFDRANPWAYNLEWATHKENIEYSHKAGRYIGLFGENNPNYNNNTLHLRYLKDKEYAKEKQSRPGGKNGKAKKCKLVHIVEGFVGIFDFQRDAVYTLIKLGVVRENINPEYVIRRLKQKEGYKGYILYQI